MTSLQKLFERTRSREVLQTWRRYADDFDKYAYDDEGSNSDDFDSFDIESDEESDNEDLFYRSRPRIKPPATSKSKSKRKVSKAKDIINSPIPMFSSGGKEKKCVVSPDDTICEKGTDNFGIMPPTGDDDRQTDNSFTTSKSLIEPRSGCSTSRSPLSSSTKSTHHLTVKKSSRRKRKPSHKSGAIKFYPGSKVRESYSDDVPNLFGASNTLGRQYSKNKFQQYTRRKFDECNAGEIDSCEIRPHSELTIVTPIPEYSKHTGSYIVCKDAAIQPDPNTTLTDKMYELVRSPSVRVSTSKASDHIPYSFSRITPGTTSGSSKTTPTGSLTGTTTSSAAQSYGTDGSDKESSSSEYCAEGGLYGRDICSIPNSSVSTQVVGQSKVDDSDVSDVVKELHPPRTASPASLTSMDIRQVSDQAKSGSEDEVSPHLENKIMGLSIDEDYERVVEFRNKDPETPLITEIDSKNGFTVQKLSASSTESVLEVPRITTTSYCNDEPYAYTFDYDNITAPSEQEEDLGNIEDYLEYQRDPTPPSAFLTSNLSEENEGALWSNINEMKRVIATGENPLTWVLNKTPIFQDMIETSKDSRLRTFFSNPTQSSIKGAG